MTDKRVKLYLSHKGKTLGIQRLVPIVCIDPRTKKLVEHDGEGHEIKTDTDAPEGILNKGYGFGTFLLSLKVEEIEYDEEVLAFMKKAINREYSSIGDLFGFSFSAPSTESYSEEFRLGNYMTFCTLNDVMLGVIQEDCQIDLEVYNEMEAHLHNIAA